VAPLIDRAPDESLFPPPEEPPAPEPTTPSRLIPQGDTDSLNAWMTPDAPPAVAPPARPAPPPPPAPPPEEHAAAPEPHAPLGGSAIETQVLGDAHAATPAHAAFEETGPEVAEAAEVEAPRGSVAKWLGIAAAVLALAGGGWVAWSQWVGPRAHPGTLVLETTPPDSEVYVDGAPGGTTPITLTLLPGEHTLELRRKGLAQTVTVSVAPGEQITKQIEWAAVVATGSLEVTSDPAGAQILVDDKRVGETPMTVLDLAAGQHTVVVRGKVGAVTNTVEIRGGETAKLDVPIFAGWLAIFCPVELQIREGGRLLGTTSDGRIMVAPGVHQLELSNDAFRYKATETVEVKPGEVKALSYEPKGTVNLNATPWAEVFVDGQRIGETPLANVPVTIGTREFVFKHPDYGEKHVTAQVILGETVLVNVDMTKQ
jgi:hypothetical protein